jgi:DNA topoisomerase IA
MNLATAVEFQAEIARLQAEIDRLRFTDAERKAIEEAMRQVVESDCIATDNALAVAATLRGLLERCGTSN